MQVKHYVILGACLVSIGAMVAGLDNWADALKPIFVGGVIGVVGAQFVALYTDSATKGQP
jgi:hypothetical protein